MLLLLEGSQQYTRNNAWSRRLLILCLWR